MSTDYVDRTATLIRAVEAQELLPHAIRLLSEGGPVVPVILGKPGVIASTCPQTGRPIRIELTPDAVERLDPAEPVMSAVRPTGELADVRADTCNHGHFFSSAAASAEWVREHPDGYVHPVEEAFRLDREVITRLGWAAR